MEEKEKKPGRTRLWLFILLLEGVLLIVIGTAGFMIRDGRKRELKTPPAAAIDGQTASEGELSKEGLAQKSKELQPEIVIRTDGSSSDPVHVSQPEESITLLFGGDVLLSDHVLGAYERGGGIAGVLGEGFLEEMRQADIFMVNQEFPFSSRGEQAPDKQYTFRLPPEKVSIFQEMGIDIVTLANNHALDFGTDALLDSCAVLDSAGICRVGAGSLEEAQAWKTMEVKGKRIAFLGVTRVIPVAEWAATAYNPGMFSTYDPTRVLEQIQAAKGENDYVVVYVHWGIEKEEYPEDYQKTMGRQYIDAGADLVIGSHPHVLQGIEYYKEKPIVYSLGNLVFGSSIPKTMLLRAELSEETMELSIIPGTSSAGFTRELTDEGEKQAFYRYFQQLSDGISKESGDRAGGIRIREDGSLEHPTSDQP